MKNNDSTMKFITELINVLACALLKVEYASHSELSDEFTPVVLSLVYPGKCHRPCNFLGGQGPCYLFMHRPTEYNKLLLVVTRKLVSNEEVM